MTKESTSESRRDSGKDIKYPESLDSRRLGCPLKLFLYELMKLEGEWPNPSNYKEKENLVKAPKKSPILTLIRLSSWYEFRFNWDTKLGLADLISGMDRLGEKETPKGSSFSICVIRGGGATLAPLLLNNTDAATGDDADWWFLW